MHFEGSLKSSLNDDTHIALTCIQSWVSFGLGLVKKYKLELDMETGLRSALFFLRLILSPRGGSFVCGAAQTEETADKTIDYVDIAEEVEVYNEVNTDYNHPTKYQ